MHYLFETPEGSPTLAGYTEPPIWAYADYVYGDSTAKQVDTLRADIEALAAAAVMQNRAAPYWDAELPRRLAVEHPQAPLAALRESGCGGGRAGRYGGDPLA